MRRERRRLKVGIIGCGAMGSEIASACSRRLKKKITLSALYDADSSKSRILGRRLKKRIAVNSVREVMRRSDMVVEAASGAAAREVLLQATRHARDCMIMSVGGLLGSERLLRAAAKKNIRVYFPSGAICGVDGLKAARLLGLKKVRLTTRKPPGGLAGAPYLRERRIDVGSIKREMLIFKGSARQAVKAFPKNINVSALLSLAGLGGHRTEVRIMASPAITRNTHEVEITGAFGKIMTRTENVPSPKNVKTSMLAVLSAIATLEGIVENMRMGT
jgi:aspartate dehydrogenase